MQSPMNIRVMKTGLLSSSPESMQRTRDKKKYVKNFGWKPPQQNDMNTFKTESLV
jgi:hypothetical protein